ncbi:MULTISPECIES: NCS2 family permease [unclassified Paenibacillus]|uniref:NCS2 family permease n=1 Tax=unclassified Paenibacillus TaxID=185978 RepID=UPI001C0F81E5|nr:MULTISPECIES: NCS2 family permease [unclassified Paenibacillus]MBU5443263.1 NCS2 family permease [Paenibacillus sp. MSJ-34]CAH0122817.1 Guanine/hypoxanthine permease PbuO [Paenibacillus sp. CECT 9249]
MDRFFKLKEHGTNVRTEIMAGITTFMAMAYILAVNPNILSGAPGGDWTSVFLATAIAAGVMTILMGLLVNFPVALAPGMGLNAYFATVIISSNGTFTFEMALTAVFISGIIFILLTVTKVRQMMIVAVPDGMKHAITVGIGLFIGFLGIKNSGLMSIALEAKQDYAANGHVPLLSFETVFQLGSLSDPNVQTTIFGLVLIGVLMVIGLRGAILFGILGTTIFGFFVGIVDFSSLSSPETTWIPDFSQLRFADFDFKGVLHAGLITVILTFTFVELFDTFGTLIGTANRAGIMKDKEKGTKKVGKAMLVDAIGVSGGALVGTSTVTAFVESSSGIAQGGRTGLTSVTTGVLFLLALFLAPIAWLIPGAATNAALIIVGVLMVQSVREIDFSNMIIAIPSFLTIVLMPLTGSIANGISFGIVTYVILATVGRLSGKSEHKVHWLMWILAVIVLARYILMGGE